MIKSVLFTMLLSCLSVFSISASAEPVSIGAADTMQNVLTSYIGKRVSIKIQSGEELTGKLVSVGNSLTHLGELSGKEFYDAVILNNTITAIIVRVK
jgi:hypothetical protein